MEENEQAERFKHRKMRESQNIFARLPPVYAASRMQGLKILQTCSNLSILEWRTLWDLSEAGPMTIREIAALQHADHSLLSRALPEMKRKGFVTTRRDADDGRQMIVEVAEAGRIAYEQAAPVMKKRRQALRNHFSPDEMETLVQLLDRLEDFFRLPIDELLDEDNT